MEYCGNDSKACKYHAPVNMEEHSDREAHSVFPD